MWRTRALLLAPLIHGIDGREDYEYRIYPRQLTGAGVVDRLLADGSFNPVVPVNAVPFDPIVPANAVPISPVAPTSVVPVDPVVPVTPVLFDPVAPVTPIPFDNSGSGPPDQTLIDSISGCSSAGPLVTSCGLTQEEWVAFDIDTFLAEAIAANGPEVQFPTAFAFRHRPQGAQSLNPFVCNTITQGSEQQCVQPVGLTPGDLSTNCLFQPLVRQQDARSACLEWTDPKAAYVVENFLKFRLLLVDQRTANENALAALTASNFVNDIVDGMAEKEGTIFDKILEFIATIPLEIITFPLTGVLKNVKRIVGNLEKVDPDLNILPSATDSALSIFNTIQRNEEIEDEIEQLKDVLTRQLAAIVATQETSLQAILTEIFENPRGSSNPITVEQARNSAPFIAAASGEYLNPQTANLQSETEDFLKNFAASSIMKSMNWQILLSSKELFDDPADPGGVCRAKGGIPDLAGSECGMFRRAEPGKDAEFDSPEPRDVNALLRLINVDSMISNARECGEGTPEPGVLGAGGLPKCFFNFKIRNVD